MRYTVAGLRLRRMRVPAIAAAAVAVTAVAGVVAFNALGSPPAGPFADTPAQAQERWEAEAGPGSGAGEQGPGEQAPGDTSAAPPGAAAGSPTGDLPDGITVHESGYPGIDGISPELLAALRSASADAGIDFTVTSGWRSAEDQHELLRDAIGTYGSAAEAARWVATPETSAHVSGEAVDLGPWDATDWLSKYGASYGLCQVYDNEAWHYEFRGSAPTAGCPERYPDASFDPRLG